jgi:hypothetical protein
MTSRRSATFAFCVCIVACSVLFLVPALFHAAPQGSSYRVIRKLPLDGDGGYDYVTVDTAARRVYVPRNNRIQVVDADSFKMIGEITGISGLHGIAVAPEFNRGFVTGAEGTAPATVAVIYLVDLKAMKITGKLTPPDTKGADGLLYDEASKRAFINMGGSNNVAAVDGATGQSVGMVTLPGRPEMASPDGKGNVFVNIVDKNLLVEYDAKALTIKNTWPVPCDRPYGNAIDTAHRLVFVGCRGKLNTAESENKMVVINADNGSVITTVPICVGTDGIAFDQSSLVAFVTCRDDGTNGLGGMTFVIHEDAPDKYTKLAEVHTIYGSRTNGLDTKTHHVFTAGTTVNDSPAPPGPAQGNGGPKQTMTSLVLQEIGK